MSRRIVVVSSNRADLTILNRLLAELQSDTALELSVIATGMHHTDEGPLQETLPAGAGLYLVGANLGSGASGAARSMGRILAESASTLETVDPELLIVTGDRLDMAPVAMAAVPFNIPMMHLHGGELTYGAVDDRLRYAITKLAHVHCVATRSASERICAMGEEPWRVHITGAPALDHLLAVPKMTDHDFLMAVGIPEVTGLRLVTVHPETNSDEPLAPARAVLGALASCGPAPTIISAPNSDPGGDAIRSMISGFVEEHNWAVSTETLGADLYANAMRRAAVMVGNSSSGLLEAGLFGLPVVNVGARQDGRERGPNVIDVPADDRVIAAAIAKVVRQPRQPTGTTPYGDGRAVNRIMNVIRGLPDRRRLLTKQWYDYAA